MNILVLTISVLSLFTRAAFAGGSSTVGPRAPVIYHACHKPGSSLENFQVSVGLNVDQTQLQLMVVDYDQQTISVEAAIKSVTEGMMGAVVQYSAETFVVSMAFTVLPVLEDGRWYTPAELFENEQFVGSLLCESLDPEDSPDLGPVLF